jgi:hypothetical protein
MIIVPSAPYAYLIRIRTRTFFGTIPIPFGCVRVAHRSAGAVSQTADQATLDAAPVRGLRRLSGQFHLNVTPRCTLLSWVGR